MSEVRYYLLEFFLFQVMSETSYRLHKAREEEKKLRKDFQSCHGNHFVTTLFPELQDRVIDISVNLLGGRGAEFLISSVFFFSA